jgi:uncharacterized protein (TIGR02271 family)
MEGTLTLDRLAEMRGTPVYSSDGDKIGSVEELFLDEDTREAEWIGLGTGLFGTKRVLVPVVGADVRNDAVYVPYAKDHVKGTPDLDGDAISQETESLLYAHYGLPYSERRSDTGLPEGSDASADQEAASDTGLPPGAPDSPGDTTEGTPTVTRSEEELRVGTRETEAGRLRLHKWVETEQVEVPVELRREKARVTREPVDRSVSDQEIGAEEIEVTLREEKPVVAKETVARERIRVDKEVEVGQETVRDELRKERVDVDDEGRRR